MELSDNGGGAAAAGSSADLLGDAGAGAGAAAGSGAGDGGAAAGAGAAGGAGTDVGGEPDWYQNLSAEAQGEAPSARDWIKSKGFKTLDELATSYRSAEQAIRDSGRVKIPGEGASEAERSAFNKAIGVPDTPEGYTIALPIGADGEPIKGADGEPIKLDETLLGKLRPLAQQLGAPKAVFEGLASEFVKMQLDEAADYDNQQKTLASETTKAWGAQKADNLAAVDAAAQHFKLTRDDLTGLRNVLGADKALNLLADVGRGMSEDRLLGGGGTRFGTDPVAAQAEMDQLKATPGFMAKASVANSAEALRWERLQTIVGQAEERKRAAGG